MEFTPTKSQNKENDIISNDNDKNDLFKNSPLKIFCSDISEIDKQNENGWTPVYRSIIANNLNVLSDLLKLGANPNLQNNIGETPLYLCVDIDNFEAITILLQNKADCNIPKKDGTTPLHFATKKKKEKFIKILLEHGANPNLINKLYSQTALHLAVKNKLNEDIILLFKNNGADFFEIKDKYGKTPYDYAKELYDENYFNMINNIFQLNEEKKEEEKKENLFDEIKKKNINENKLLNQNSLFKNIDSEINNNRISDDYTKFDNDKDKIDIINKNIIGNNKETEEIKNSTDKNNNDYQKDVSNLNQIENEKNIDTMNYENKEIIFKDKINDNNNMIEEINNINNEKEIEIETKKNIIKNNKEEEKTKIYKPKKSIKRKPIKNINKKVKPTKINKNILKKELIHDDNSEKQLLTTKGKENNLGLGITLTSSENDIYKSNTVKNMPSLINEPKLSTLSESDFLKNIILDTAKKIRTHNINKVSNNISNDNKENIFSPINTMKSEKTRKNSKENFNKTLENGLSNNIKRNINNEIEGKREINTMNPLDMMNQIITTNSNISDNTQEQLNNKFNTTNLNYINKDSDLLEYSKSYVTNATHLNNTEENNLTSNNNGANNNTRENSSSKKNESYKKISYHCGKFLNKNNKGIDLNNNFNEIEKENDININNEENENVNDDESYENSDIYNENIKKENINSQKYQNLNINNNIYMHSTYDNSKYNSILDSGNNNKNKQISYNSQINSNSKNNSYNENIDLFTTSTPVFNANSYKENLSRNRQQLKLNNISGKKIANTTSCATYNPNMNYSSSKKYAKKLAILTELENSKNNSINQPMRTSISNLEDNDSIINLGSGQNIIPNELSSKLHDWLISCDLLCYYNLLIKNKIIDINKYIEDIKSNKKVISYKTVEDLGIKKPGHIYRFLLKIKLDSNMIDPYIYNSVFDKYNRSSLNDLKISMSNTGYRIGCCCFRDSNLKLDKRSINSGLEFAENTSDIFAFLRKMNLLKFKENFIHNGFDQVEFIMLQLFSEYKFNKEILNEYLHIYSDEDKVKVISKLYNEKKNLCLEYNIKYDENEDKDIYESCLKDYKDNENNNGICSIF